MQETITMSGKEQRRAWILTKLLVGELTVAEAAALMQLSQRQVWRLKLRFECDGPAALVHANRGRASPRRLPEAVREQILELARGRYAGVNDCHLASPRRRRRPRHRSRRERMPQAGLLLQVDGSRHDWLQGRGPRLTLVGGIDDATGTVTGATFREQEDAAGYLEVMRDTVRRHGVPAAVYRDRHTIFEASDRALTLEEQLADTRLPTQVGRALDELGITSIAAHSPQAKGRVERLWGTFQDRLVTELRLAAAADREAANRVLAAYLPKFNRRFTVPAADPTPAWRPAPGRAALERICCLKYRRVVANDHTIRAGASILQLPPLPKRRGYAGARVELQLRLDGRMVVWDGQRVLLSTPAPADAIQLRTLAAARSQLGERPPSARPGYKPAANHPWRHSAIGARARQPLTESLRR